MSAILFKFNSLAPVGFDDILEKWFFKLLSVIDGWAISSEIALRLMSLDLIDDKSTLVQVMAWCRQQKAITWPNVGPDLCHHVAWLGHNELNIKLEFKLIHM